MIKPKYERKVLEDVISLKKMRTGLHFSFESLAVHGGRRSVAPLPGLRAFLKTSLWFVRLLLVTDEFFVLGALQVPSALSFAPQFRRQRV